MSSLLSSHESAIRLIFDGRTHVAGERVFGAVELDFRMALEDKIEQVRVKLRGFASTRITRSNGQSTTTYRSSLPLVHDEMILWTQGTYPPPGQHIIQLPFEFRLPRDLPGSLHSSAHHRSATISYGVEVVADRPGFFRFNRRLGQVFPVLPIASQEQVEDALHLGRGWSGVWSTTEKEDMIRKRLWGEYSHVKAQFQCPSLASFPVGVPIPVCLVVTSVTKTMSKSETPEDAFTANPHKPLFPQPTHDPKEIRFRLDTLVNIKARHRNASIDSHLLNLGGFRESNVTTPRVTPSEPVWLPNQEKGEEGKWKREVRFDTSIVLTCPPTLDVGIINCSYLLNIEVPFPGIGNDLEFMIPLHVNSGFGPFDPNAPPPPAFDLPPSYFTGEYHDWDGDEKSG